MSTFDRRFEWTSPSADPNDETFGDVVEPAPPERADAYDAVLVGEPYDGAVVGRRGAAEGPAAVREALAATATHHFDAGPVGRVADAGDVVTGFTDAASVQDEVAAAVAPLHDARSLPVFVGGDNSLTAANARPLLDAGWDAVGALSFDAHLDCREPVDGPTSGTPYRQLLEAGLDAYACVGARHFETSTAYADYVRARDGTVVTAEEVGEDPVAAVDVALDALDVDALHVSVDVDVVDASAAPGASAPTPGGVTTRELFRMVRLVAGDERVASFEVVECAPPLDEGGRTAAAAARAVAHFLAGYGAGRDATTRHAAAAGGAR